MLGVGGSPPRLSVPTGSPESFRTSREERRRGLRPSASLRDRCQPWRLGRRPPRSARSSAFVSPSHTAASTRLTRGPVMNNLRLMSPSSAHRPARAGRTPRPSHIRSPASMFSHSRWRLDTVMVRAWAALSLDPKRPACSVPTLRSEAPNCDRAGSPGLDDVRGRRVFCDVAPLQDRGCDGQRWSGDQLGTRASRALQGRRRADTANAVPGAPGGIIGAYCCDHCIESADRAVSLRNVARV